MLVIQVNKKWTKEEEEVLRDLYINKNLTRKEVAIHLQRSEGSVRKRLYVLGIKKDISSRQANHNKWTKEEREKIDELLSTARARETLEKRDTVVDACIEHFQLYGVRPTRKYIAKKINWNYRYLSYFITELNLQDYFLANATLEDYFKDMMIENNILNMNQAIQGSYPLGKKNGQLDFYFPTLNLGIEINDFISHSSYDKKYNQVKDKFYHQRKTLNFWQEKNIRVIHLWEDEIFNGHEVITEKIYSTLDKQPIFLEPQSHNRIYHNTDIYYYDDGCLWI